MKKILISNLFALLLLTALTGCTLHSQRRTDSITQDSAEEESGFTKEWDAIYAASEAKDGEHWWIHSE